MFDPFLGNKEGGATRRVASESNSAQNIGAPFAHLINEVETLSTSPKINPTLQRLDVSRMLKEPPPPVPWIVDGIVARGYLTVIHGDGGIGKSFLALQLCVAAMSGGRFLDRDTKRCRVLYVDAENGEGEAHRRLHLLGAEDGIAEFFEYVVADGHDLIKNSDELEDMVARCHPDLIVVDSLASLWSIKENDSTEMTRAMMVLTRIAARYEAGVIALHHDKKDGTSYRGSGAANAACQVRFQLLRHSTDDTEDATKLVLQRKKNRMGPQDLRIYLQIINSAGRLEVTEVSKHVTATQEAIEQAILEALNDGATKTNREIALALGHRSTSGSVSRAVRDLVEREVLVRGKHGVTITKPTPDPTIHLLESGSLDQDSPPPLQQLEPRSNQNQDQIEGSPMGEDDIDWGDNEEAA